MVVQFSIYLRNEHFICIIYEETHDSVEIERTLGEEIYNCDSIQRDASGLLGFLSFGCGFEWVWLSWTFL